MTNPPYVKGSSKLFDGITVKDQKARVIAGLIVAVILATLGIIVRWLYPIVWDRMVTAIPLTPYLVCFVLAAISLLLFLKLLRYKKSFPAGWEGIERTGLSDYHPKLDGSPFHPEHCMDGIGHHLYFMGHGARKWTAQMNELEEMLKRVRIRNGEAFFLIFNPCHEENAEEAKEIAESLLRLRALRQKYGILKIKIYDHPPQFRLMFIDNEILVIGHYKGIKRGDSKDTPLFVYSEKADWSFYYAFQSHFKAEWDAADEPAWDKVTDLAGINA